MNNYKFRDKSGKMLIRISKTRAKALYEAGDDVLFIPAKCNPANDLYSLAIWENKFLAGQYETFEKLVDYYTGYNCSRETGYYPAFYIYS